MAATSAWRSWAPVCNAASEPAAVFSRPSDSCASLRSPSVSDSAYCMIRVRASSTWLANSPTSVATRPLSSTRVDCASTVAVPRIEIAARTTRSARTTAKPPRMRERIDRPSRLNGTRKRDTGYPLELGSLPAGGCQQGGADGRVALLRRADLADQVSTELFLELRLRAGHGGRELGGVDLGDDLHAGLAESLDALR